MNTLVLNKVAHTEISGLQIAGSSSPHVAKAPARAVLNEEDVFVARRYWKEHRPAVVGNAFCSRSFDVLVSFLAIVILLPVFLVIAAAIVVSDPGPIIFRQQRIGRYGKLFPCLKFRTMTVDAQHRLDELLQRCPAARAEWAADQKLRNDPRITPIGRFLRKSSLDELPQLFNIFIGQMSIVGPRPIIQAEVVRYGERFLAYCSCRPGLTGLWQISGRNNISYKTRVRLDARYAARKGFGYDILICVRTVPAILASRGSF